MYIKYVLYCVHLSNWFTDRMEGILGAAYYNRQVGHALPENPQQPSQMN